MNLLKTLIVFITLNGGTLHWANASQEIEAFLIKDFEKAQKTYHEGTLKEARDQFMSLVEKYETQSLTGSTKELLHYALLRCAQLTSSEQLRSALLAKAWKFADSSGIDLELFPPPLVLEYINQKPSDESMKANEKELAVNSVRVLDSPKPSETEQRAAGSSKKKWLYWGLGALGVVAGVKIYQHNFNRGSDTGRVSRVPQTSISF